MMQESVTPGRRIMGRLAKGDDLVAALENICRANAMTLGEVRALGAVSRARVGYYHQAQQQYQFLELARPLEIVSLLGNVSLKEGQAMVHAHVTLADKDGRVFGGHLAEGTVVFACEYVIQEYLSNCPFARQLDEATGLFLWPVR